MLTQETKRKIDSARDILVGKVPDPKAQVEQITTALIYKFMDDMDKGSQELGGKARFFTGGFEKYSWTKLMDPKLGGHDRMDLYVETLTKLSLNPHIPQLFRDIFKDAFLPYRSPETLSLFLKEINGFTYEHSEDLGDSFEYLLSVLGSQGDAGQFRTPRHIIDFIVAAIDPKKEDKVCDPACGTAGFLISAYKHILKQHDGKDDPENKEKPLTPDERKNLMDHFTGYDISPDMVRLSRVNLYLHGFPNPTIYEYDTLSSEEKWDESFDVMLANPPFMTPKGGIKPHKRFSVQANRSEVLFVDYILEHLRPNGRAGIIVPEGIIFKSETAYKALRKMLVEDGLLAVVSLPSGVFNPYAGVKTGILLFDKALAKKTQELLFVKIENDGYGLGAQRREIDKNDLPQALEIIKKYKTALKTDKPFELEEDYKKLAQIVAKEKIAQTGDYNLSGDGYKEVLDLANQKWPRVAMGDVAEFLRGPFGSSIKRSVCVPKGKDTYKVYEQGNVIQNDFNRGNYYISKEKFTELKKFELKLGDIVITCAGTIGKTAIVPSNIEEGIINSVLMRIRTDDTKVVKKYFLLLLNSQQIQNNIGDKATGVALKNMFATSELKKFTIPLPPIEVQRGIIEQIEIKQQAIEHAKAIIKNLERERAYFGQSLRKLKDIEWVELGKIGKICMCKRIFKDQTTAKGDIPFYKIGTFGQKPDAYISQKIYDEYTSKYPHPKKGDILISTSGTIGRIVVYDGKPAYFQDSNIVWIDNDERLVFTEYLYHTFQSIQWTTTKGGTIERLYNKLIEKTKIPVPPFEVQQQLVAEAEKEEEIITANRRLIELYEQKISQVLAEI